jgi:hypothetical protein
MVAATLAVTAGGVAAGYWAVPAFLRHPTGTAGRAAFCGVVLLGFAWLTGTIVCVVEAWPLPVYGPRPEPRPLPLWLALLRVACCWLLTLPFSLICGLGVWAGIDAALAGAWLRAAAWLGIGAAFGAGGALLVAGSGEAAQAGVRPGRKVPSAIRRSRWWRRVLWLLAGWAVLLTGLAIYNGVQGNWRDFADTLSVAVSSWIALAVAARGELPTDAFSS